MGLNVSHGAFDGAYSAFNRFRGVVAKAMGGSHPPHEDKNLDPTMWYWGDGYNRETNQGLFEFLAHSDCDGEISPEICVLVANDLEALLPKIKEIEGSITETGGHIVAQGGYVKVTEYFIEGCRLAVSRNENLIFR